MVEITDDLEDEYVDESDVVILAPLQLHTEQQQQLRHLEQHFEYEVHDVVDLDEVEVEVDGIDEVEHIGNDEVDEVDMYIIHLLVEMLQVDIAIVLIIF